MQDNNFGQLGRGDTVPSFGLSPPSVCNIAFISFAPSMSSIIDLNCGFNHSCAVFGGGNNELLKVRTQEKK